MPLTTPKVELPLVDIAALCSDVAHPQREQTTGRCCMEATAFEVAPTHNGSCRHS